MTAFTETTRPHYLEPSFDASKATVNELKSILTACNIDLPRQNALKKQDYLLLFNQQVGLKANEIWQSISSIKPSSDGILCVETEAIKTVKFPDTDNERMTRSKSKISK